MDSEPSKIVTLVDWGWAYIPPNSPTESGLLVIGSPDGREQIRYPMTQATIRALRQAMMGIDIVTASESLDG